MNVGNYFLSDFKKFQFREKGEISQKSSAETLAQKMDRLRGVSSRSGFGKTTKKIDWLDRKGTRLNSSH